MPEGPKPLVMKPVAQDGEYGEKGASEGRVQWHTAIYQLGLRVARTVNL